MLRTVGEAIMLGGVALLAVGAVQLAMGEGFPAGLVFGGLGALLGGALLRDVVKNPRTPGGSFDGDSPDCGGDGGGGR
jgi:hypothetical protein